MRSRILSFLFICLFSITALGCQATQKSTDELKPSKESIIIQILGEFYSSQTHTIEQRATNHVEKFIRNKLLASLLDGSTNTYWNEYVVSGDHMKNLHIGILKLNYSTQSLVNSAAAEFIPSGFLKASKILTPFSSKASEKSILIVYTETYMHPDRKHVMSQLIKEL